MPRLGLHWFLEGASAEPERLVELARVRAVLQGVPTDLGLTVLSEPDIRSDAAAGTLGSVLLAESHFTLRSVPERGLLWADLFSCRPVDFAAARDAVVSSFALRDVHTRVVERAFDDR